MPCVRRVFILESISRAGNPTPTLSILVRGLSPELDRAASLQITREEVAKLEHEYITELEQLLSEALATWTKQAPCAAD